MKRIKKYLVNFSYASQALLITSFLNILKIFPYRLRILTGSIIFRFFLSPLTGNKKRIENNLNLVLPDLLESDKKNLIKNCLHNIGMTMFELLSPHDFKLSGKKANILGPGIPLLVDGVFSALSIDAAASDPIAIPDWPSKLRLLIMFAGELM